MMSLQWDLFMKLSDTDTIIPGSVLVGENTAAIRLDKHQNIVQSNETAQRWLNAKNGDLGILNERSLAARHVFLCDRKYRSINIADLLQNRLTDPYVGINHQSQTVWTQVHILNDGVQQDYKILLLTDVSELVNELMSLQQLAENASTKDLHTGLFNRRHAMHLLDQMHHHAKRYQSPFSIAMIDIDHFKRINDTFGHAFGDKALARIAEIILSNFRETDFCARYGGEEFLVMMPETDATNAILTIDRLRQQISELKWQEIHRPITVSAGVVEWAPKQSIEQLIFLSDQRLLTAKKAGRNQVCGELA